MTLRRLAPLGIAVCGLLATFVRVSTQANFRIVSTLQVSYEGAMLSFGLADFVGNGTTTLIAGGFRYPIVDQTLPFKAINMSRTGVLSDISATLFDGVPAQSHARRGVVADFNSDGRPDFFSAGQGYDASPWPGDYQILLLSQPNGKLKNESGTLLPGVRHFVHSAAAADVKRTGLQDVFVGVHQPQQVTGLESAYGAPTAPQPNWLGAYVLRNDGNGRFTFDNRTIADKVTFGYNTSVNPWVPFDSPGAIVTSAFSDLDNDGYADLILGADLHAAHAGSVYLNDRTGGFRTTEYKLPVGLFGATNTITVDILPMDVDQDGRLDLVLSQTANSPVFYGGTKLQILMNRSGSVFADETATRLPGQSGTGRWVEFLNGVDLDGDGVKDILLHISYPDAGQVIAYRNDGRGNFAPLSASYLPPTGYPWLTAVDFNGDERVDFVSINNHTQTSTTTFTLFENVNPQTFCTYSLSSASASFSLAGGTGTVNVATSAGCAWTAASPLTWLAFVGASGSAVTGTGSATITYTVVANTSTSSRLGTVTVAGQTFTITQTSGGSGGSGGATGSTLTGVVDFTPRALDLNGDGRGDLFSYNQTTGAWRWDLENGALTRSGSIVRTLVASTSGSWDAGWTVKAGDFNNDGRSDVFLYHSTTGRWFKAISNGANNFNYYTELTSTGCQIAIGNFGGSAAADVFFYNVTSGAWAKCVSTGDGNAGFSCDGGSWDPGWQVHPVETNGDTVTDLFLYNATSGVRLHAYPATTGFTYANSGTWSAGWGITPGAYDGSAGNDFVLYNSTTGQWSIIGGASLNAVGSGVWSPGWTVKSGDLNGDGLTDLFLYNASSGSWFECFNNGAGDWTYASGRWEPGWQISITSFNGDARADLLLYNSSSGAYVQCISTGSASFMYYSGNLGSGMTVVAARPFP